MSQKKYIWINGEMVISDTPILTSDNRSFLYGDGLFETIHAYGTLGRNLNLHISRIKQGMKLLNIEIPTYFDEQMLSKEITRLLNKNRYFGSARVRLTVFRNPGGKYTPTDNAAGFLIEADPLETKMYELNSKGIVVDIFTELKKPLNPLSSIKSCNSLFYILAGIYQEKNGLNDCILINSNDRIAEAISSNIFIVKGDTLFTPSVSEGCIPGIMREVIIKVAPKIGFNVKNQVAIPPQNLLDCDEVFLTNSITGIKWVVAFRQQRYFNKVSKLLTDVINRFTFPDQFSEGFSG
ncbi:MAG: aminotransferase class IV [Tenuifilaceae bacterium]